MGRDAINVQAATSQPAPDGYGFCALGRFCALSVSPQSYPVAPNCARRICWPQAACPILGGLNFALREGQDCLMWTDMEVRQRERTWCHVCSRRRLRMEILQFYVFYGRQTEKASLRKWIKKMQHET